VPSGPGPAAGNPWDATSSWSAQEATGGGGGTQVLTFLLDGEEYGVDILRVQEIKGWDRVTPIPNTAECVRGVINLRGTVVPILDLRLRFGKAAIPYSKTTVIIVLKVQAGRGERIVGLIVDAVSDVYNIAASQMRESPALGGAAGGGCVKGLATVGEKLVILLDIDQLVSSTVEAPGPDRRATETRDQSVEG